MDATMFRYSEKGRYKLSRPSKKRCGDKAGRERGKGY